MRKQDFHFELPEHLIANEPAKTRSLSRLMVLDPLEKDILDKQFFELVDFLQPEDCLIFNNTKVIPARLSGKRETGGKVEVLIERVTPGNGGQADTCIAQLRASNSPKTGAQVIVAEDLILNVVGREGTFFRLESANDRPLLELVEQYGSMPLPPYIQREAGEDDKSRYQTVYAVKQGAVAAPTAGLHFDDEVFAKIAKKGISYDFVTLHVGAGTFSPVRVDNIKEHQMHSEWFEVPESVVELVRKTRDKGGRVIAIGTTSVRCLESASVSGELEPTCGETNIFIYPGYEFKSVDALVTNFHLSESTLIMLVSAFAGKDFILEAYNHAVSQKYRFFSYGDSMFIQNRMPAENNGL
ncbi:tRNA preQ1(34) S-adenosylmethionine ribosyltransferase-isomerase QueA [Aliikangiella sp. G2MR2-5]|uniref:tRNA preQ1(34) S-adenosylmethionine ribosyltransferase-isomerase QueA n=1 Tax=Aliikangiella sp. G2MR2-5 TaxID=2788943 RepID=UPI0018AC39FF